MSPSIRLLAVCLIMAVATTLRLPLLTLRPMHTDEAVHAAKMGQLLETGRYIYDPVEYHGPTLNALTLPIAWLRSQTTYQGLDEVTLRLVPVLCGLGLVLLPLLMGRGIGARAALLAVAFTALSPALVFYSRYYIQETLLVFFTGLLLGSLWRYLQCPHVGWIVLAGLSCGLMHATKETAIINFGCLGLSLLLLVGLERPQWRRRLQPHHLAYGLCAAIGLSALLFTWFGTHPQGWWDSFRTYAVYFNRAGHGHAHIHPWYYYLDLLTWIEGFEWPGWNEDYLVVVAVVGMLYAFFKKELPGANILWVRFLTLYTFLMTVVYSAIPYKTPWSMLGCLQGMILLAAVGTDQFLKNLPDGWEKRMVVTVMVIFGLLSPLGQSIALNFYKQADPTNPYVYAHTHPDMFQASAAIRSLAQTQKNAIVQVVCPGDDYWPLPWTLRDLPQVGYAAQVDVNQPLGDIIVIQPEIEPDVLRWVYEKPPPGQRELYVPILAPTTQLRHGVELRAYARKSWVDAAAQEASP
ncbi:flippase activity-associated protein Agl23 [Planctomycetota bacterium]